MTPADPATSAERVARSIPLRRKMLYAIVPAVLLVVGVEAALRLAGFEHRPDVGGYLVIAWERNIWHAETMRDPDVLYRFTPREADAEPNADGLLPLRAIRINSLGYRGDDFATTKHDHDANRILAYGDSVTFGVYLAEQATIPALLAERLCACGYKIDMLNLALPSYTSSQNLWDFEARGLGYEPDVLLLHLGCWNDFSVTGNKRTDYQVRAQSEIQARLFEPMSQLRLGQLLVKFGEGIAESRADAARRRMQSEHHEAHVAWPDDIRRVELPEFRRNVERFLELARKHELSVLLIVPAQPTGTQEDMREIYTPYYDVLRAIPESDRVRVVELQPIVDAAGGDDLFIDFVHYNPAGARVVADALVEPMAELLDALQVRRRAAKPTRSNQDP